MKVRALIAFVWSRSGTLTSVAYGEVLTVTNDEKTALLNAGLAEAYNPEITITANGTYDVSDYESAVVNVA